VIGPGHGVRLGAVEVVAGAVVCPGDVGPPVDPAGAVKIGVALELGPVPGSVALPRPPRG